MNISVDNYVVVGETNINHDSIPFVYNMRYGNDTDVIEMWIKDECVHQYGVDIEQFNWKVVR